MSLGFANRAPAALILTKTNICFASKGFQSVVAVAKAARIELEGGRSRSPACSQVTVNRVSSEILVGRGTAVRFDRQIEQSSIASRTRQIAQQVEGNASMVCYVFGMGSHPMSTYASVAKMDGVRLLWSTSVLPKKWRWLKRLVASEAGLLKIEKISALEEVFDKVVHSAMAAIYVLPKSAEKKFVTEVRNNPTPSDMVLA